MSQNYKKIEIYRNYIIEQLKKISLMWIDKPELKKTIDYTLLNCGKLARSVIILLGLDDLNVNPLLGLDIACALEMIQSYTLIHDDLPEMDNATMRRGKRTNHLVYGHGQALLAGDTLLTDSFLIIARSNLNDSQKNKLVELFSEKAGSCGVCYGQILDLNNENNNFSIWNQIEKIIALKTSSLFELAFISIGIIAKLEQPTQETLKKIGYLFGLAFQIKDDLNDSLKETTIIGKDVSQDNNKCTYHKIYGINAANLKIDQILKELKGECTKIFGLDNKIYDYLSLLIK